MEDSPQRSPRDQPNPLDALSPRARGLVEDTLQAYPAAATACRRPSRGRRCVFPPWPLPDSGQPAKRRQRAPNSLSLAKTRAGGMARA